MSNRDPNSPPYRQQFGLRAILTLTAVIALVFACGRVLGPLSILVGSVLAGWMFLAIGSGKQADAQFPYAIIGLILLSLPLVMGIVGALLKVTFLTDG